MRQNTVKQSLTDGGIAVGTMAFEFMVPALPQIADVAGADFVLFDMEHAGLSTERLATLAAVTRGTDVVPLVRVPKADYQLMSRPLDVGVMGIMAPSVESKAQAEALVAATKYPPAGHRGTAFGIAHDGYRKGDARQKMQDANEQTLLIAQIETPPGVDNVDEIASVEGIDVLWMGHNDLTTAMGIPGQFDHAEYLDAEQRMLDACEKFGRAAGFRCDSADHGRKLAAQGFRCLAYLNDIVIYRDNLASGLQAVRSAASEAAV